MEEIIEEKSSQDRILSLFAEIIHNYKRPVTDDECHLHLERECVWSHAIAFYKKSPVDKSRLRKKLVVSLEGEEGVDAGAISMEYFRLVLE